MSAYSNKILYVLGGIFITMFFLLPLISPYFRELFLAIISRYPFAAPLVIIVFRFLGVVIAPLPGMPVAFTSILLLPWWEAGLYNFIGSASGGICAFFIARKFRERAVAYFAPLQKVHAWQDQLLHKKQLLAFIMFRFVSIGAFDFVVYAIGLTKVSFKTYLVTVFLVDLPVMAIFFYAGGLSFKYSIYVFITFMVLLFLFSLFVMRGITHTKNT